MADSPPSAFSTVSPSDETLLSQFAETRDAEAFGRLVGRHLARVRGSARRLCPDPATADDIAQAVFILLARRAEDLSRRSLLRNTGYVAGFLHRATVLTAMDIRRSERRRLRRERGAARAESARTTEVELPVEVDTALNSLGGKDRDVLLYRYWQGLSPDETAAQLGITPAAVAKRLTRALARLRKQLALPTATTGAAIPPELLLQTHPDSTLPANESFVVETVRMSLPGTSSGLSALPATAAIAARAVQRFALLGAARTAASVVAAVLVALTPVLAANSLIRPAANFAPTLLSVAPPAPDTRAAELPPDSLLGEALVDWLIARNEMAAERYKAVRFTVVQERSANGNVGSVEQADVLLDFPRYRINAIPAVEPGVKNSLMPTYGPRTVIRTTTHYVSYSPRSNLVSVTELPPGGALHPNELNAPLIPHLFTSALFGGSLGSEPLRAYRARIATGGRTLIATRSTDAATGRTLFRIGTLVNGEASPMSLVIDPERDYLITAVEYPDKSKGGITIRMQFTTVGGLHIPSEIEQTQWGPDGSAYTWKQTLTNITVGKPVADAEFQTESLGLPNGTGRWITTVEGLRDPETTFFLNGKWLSRDEYRRQKPQPATAPAK